MIYINYISFLWLFLKNQNVSDISVSYQYFHWELTLEQTASRPNHTSYRKSDFNEFVANAITKENKISLQSQKNKWGAFFSFKYKNFTWKSKNFRVTPSFKVVHRSIFDLYLLFNQIWGKTSGKRYIEGNVTATSITRGHAANLKKDIANCRTKSKGLDF